MVGFGIAVLVQLGQIVLSFYGFWLVWRVLLPVLPGPREPDKRIARYAGYFTDPLTAPLIRFLRLPPWLAALVLLVTDATALAALAWAN
jgi:hypothetical protein